MSEAALPSGSTSYDSAELEALDAGSRKLFVMPWTEYVNALGADATLPAELVIALGARGVLELSKDDRLEFALLLGRLTEDDLLDARSRKHFNKPWQELFTKEKQQVRASGNPVPRALTSWLDAAAILSRQPPKEQQRQAINGKHSDFVRTMEEAVARANTSNAADAERRRHSMEAPGLPQSVARRSSQGRIDPSKSLTEPRQQSSEPQTDEVLLKFIRIIFPAILALKFQRWFDFTTLLPTLSWVAAVIVYGILWGVWPRVELSYRPFFEWLFWEPERRPPLGLVVVACFALAILLLAVFWPAYVHCWWDDFGGKHCT
jgi:hypothetical protein